jgi:ParB family transcriptional regulator, chromosome partitioning protein
LLDLLACLTAAAIEPAYDGAGAMAVKKRHADQLAETLDLDMTRYWQPTPETFFGKVTKATILDAVRDSVSAEAADNFADLKKDALIQHAADRMADTNWLPEILRRPDDPDTALAA